MHRQARDQVVIELRTDRVRNQRRREEADERREQQAVDDDHEARAFEVLDLRMLDLVGRLASKVRVGVLTNNGLMLLETIDDLFPELRPLFGKHIYCSAEFGVRKPDHAVYRLACERMNAACERCLFLDDRQDNAEGARLAGLLGHHYTGITAFEKLIQHLLP